MSRPTILTHPISAAETIPLRHRVLREGLPRETAHFAGDDLPTTTHWGAFSPAGELVAVATLLCAPKPGTTEPGWQLRGMASSPAFRGQGYGAAVLQAVIDHVATRLGTPAMIWCNARKSAVGFYLAHGFRTEGTEFEIPGVGAHWVMSYAVRPRTSGRAPKADRGL